jgi:hypothetical protein
MKKSVKLAIIDHISSASAILYPIKKIAEVTTTLFGARKLSIMTFSISTLSIMTLSIMQIQYNANSA